MLHLFAGLDTFTSQNMGARRYDNLDRVMRNCLLCAAVTGLVLGGGASLLGGKPLFWFYARKFEKC